ncbi:hypothetical protein RQP46_006213 [Phenoliferia psychrophenolica]
MPTSVGNAMTMAWFVSCQNVVTETVPSAFSPDGVSDEANPKIKTHILIIDCLWVSTGKTALDRYDIVGTRLLTDAEVDKLHAGASENFATSIDGFVKQQIPVYYHRALIRGFEKDGKVPYLMYLFPQRHVFYQSALSLGLVNLKPLVPGHVLVIPKRVTPRFGDLTPEEVCDLFLSVQTISRVVEKEYNAGCVFKSFGVEAKELTNDADGPLAGQSVPHTHIHIMPRQPNDFQPLDAVYTALDSNNFDEDYRRRKVRADREEKGVDADEGREARSKEEMKDEARRLSELFPENVRGTFED